MKNILVNLNSYELVKFFQSLAGEIRVKEYSERACMKEIIKKNPKILFSLLRILF